VGGILTFFTKRNRFSDPEFNNSNSNAIGVGGYFQSPPTRSYGFSLNNFKKNQIRGKIF
jgi:hypothetical protein